ncbi:MAG TPA: prolipoprotein diacylglyceryl transferase [Clostridia bacterium]|nr:prolipoprotein diacylglyceryl transferase [Clostridia bacterium]
MESPITFPGLHLTFNIQRQALSFGKFGIYWYGIIIATGLVIAILYGLKRSKSFGITQDDLIDVIVFSIIAAIIGARLYFVLFYIDPSSGTNPYFSDPASIFNVRSGGLAIYGGIIGAFVCATIVCKIKKISTGAVFDIAALGFLIGQSIGRWGNFINREAYGAATSLPWRMVVDSTGTGYHPCFLYESLWCILGFIILHIYSKRRKFNGEIFLMYLMWYSFGRFFIEGLRTDSLMLGNLRISQLVAGLLFVAAGIFIYLKRQKSNGLTDDQGEYKRVYEDAAEAVRQVSDNSDETQSNDLPEDMKNDSRDDGGEEK